MSQLKTSSRLITIDFLRGIAAIGVMLYHAGNTGIFVKRGEVAQVSWLESIGIYPISFGFTGVYLFFVISGFCIHLRWVKSATNQDTGKPLDFISFWKRRFQRIYPAYIV